MKLNKLVTVRTGKNFSRNKVSKEEVVPYTYDDLTKDLSEFAPYRKDGAGQKITAKNEVNSDEDNYLVSSGDVVFSFVSSTAGIVSKCSEGKVLNQNFAKLISVF